MQAAAKRFARRGRRPNLKRVGTAPEEQTQIRVSNLVRDFLLGKAKHHESIDCALRRLLKLKPCWTNAKK